MLKPEFTGQFKKDYKLAVKRGCDPQKLSAVVELLCEEKPLPSAYRDHALTNSKNYKDMRECHIQPDWLLVYRIENDLLVLTLSRTGTHSVKSLYFVSVHPMQKQQKPDILLPPDAYAKTHNYVSAGSIEPFI